MIYLDSSALVTLVLGRTHAAPLRELFLRHPAETTATSTVGLVETVRTCDSHGNFPNLLARLARVHVEIPLTDRVRDAATAVPGRLRSLDAIHVASAELLGSELTALVTYDKRIADAARAAGLPVAMPGVE
ncbi:MAG TPA: PIN domain-containing protein [Mycobacteriales bacterium]|nr:PIN domain-containing protein [Mycobacteriales bacterium]